MVDWPLVRIGDLVVQGALAISDGYRVRNEELGPEGIPFVRGGDIGDGWINTRTSDRIRPELSDRVRSKLTRPGDAAFITKGTVGRAGRLRSDQPPVVFAPQIAFWRVLDHSMLDAGFIYYLMRSRPFKAALDSVKTHGAMVADYVSISQQHDFRLRLPDIRSQRAIAQMLGALDDKIELNRRMNETLAQMARTLFQEWFVDGEPASHSDGWHEATLGDLMSVDKGVSYKGSGLVEDSGAIMVNLGCFTGDGRFNAAKLKRYDGSFRSQHVVAPGDLVLANTDMTQRRVVLGSPAIVPRLGGDATTIIHSHHVFACRFSQESERWKLFVYFTLLSPAFREVAEGYATGTTVLALRRQDLLGHRIRLPPQERILAFNDIASSLNARDQVSQIESQVLARLRDTLLPRLISGELRIPEAERIVSEVT